MFEVASSMSIDNLCKIDTVWRTKTSAWSLGSARPGFSFSCPTPTSS
jgi:hypothetical protein